MLKLLEEMQELLYGIVEDMKDRLTKREKSILLKMKLEKLDVKTVLFSICIIIPCLTVKGAKL